MTQADIAARLDVSVSSITRLLLRNKADSEAIPQQQKGTGRTRILSDKNMATLHKQLIKNPWLTPRMLKQMNPRMLRNCSCRTIRRRILLDLDMVSTRTIKKPFLTKKMKLSRIKFANQHLKWTKKQWDSVLWCDESIERCFQGTKS